MKKMLWVAAIAFAMISCGNKAAENAEEAVEEAAPVEVVEEAAPAAEVKEEPKAEAEPAQEEKEKSLIQRAVELGEDVADEVQKNK